MYEGITSFLIVISIHIGMEQIKNGRGGEIEAQSEKGRQDQNYPQHRI